MSVRFQNPGGEQENVVLYRETRDAELLGKEAADACGQFGGEQRARDVLDQRAAVVRLDGLLDLGVDGAVQGVEVVEAVRERTTEGRVFCLELDEVVVPVDTIDTV